MSDQNLIPIYLHNHTSFSNESVPRHEGIEASSHLFEPYRFANANYGADSVSAVTDHFETEGKENWYRTAEKFETNDWSVEFGEKVMKAERDDTAHYGMNGVEATLEDKGSHDREFLIWGLDLEDQREHLYEDFDAVLRTAEKDAEMVAVPHPYMMEFAWKEEEFEEFFEAAQDYEVETGVELPLGYGFLNYLADGRIGSEENVADICEQYEVPAVPGTDNHSYIPRKKTLIDSSATDKLEDDEIPLREMKDMSIATSPGLLPEFLDKTVDTVGAGTAFSGRIPLAGPLFREMDGFHRAVRDLSMEINEGFDVRSLENEAVRVNGRNGYLDQRF